MPTKVIDFTAEGGAKMSDTLSGYHAGLQGIILFDTEYRMGQIIPQDVIDQIPEDDLNNLVVNKKIFHQGEIPRYP
jgi:hypothetical protein